MAFNAATKAFSEKSSSKNKPGATPADLACISGREGLKSVGEEEGHAATNKQPNYDRHGGVTPFWRPHPCCVFLFPERFIGLGKRLQGGDHFVASVGARRAAPGSARCP